MQDNQNNIRVRYIHDGTGRLILTLATQFIDEAKTQLAVAEAHCSPNDIPSRKRGRQIATGRLEMFLSQQREMTKNVGVMAHQEFINRLHATKADAAERR
jgi:hypothetical protein